jgi:hypothetical protein
MASCWLLGILTSDPDKFGTQYTMLEWIWSKLLMCQCQACLLVSATILVSASECQLSKGTDTASATQGYKDEDSSRQAHALAGACCLGKLTHSQEHAQCVNLPTCAGPHSCTHMHTRAHDLMRSSMRLSVARKCHVLSSGEKSRAHQQSHGWG